MSRRQTLPRVEVKGVRYIELYRASTLRKLDTSAIPNREVLGAVVAQYDKNLRVVREFFELQTGHSLLLHDDGEDTVWLVLDSLAASTTYRSLSNKAHKFEELVIERTNEFASGLSGE